ncbi:MAG: DUF2203 family protein [Streptosporangiales bacterium]|nr:DUF2203 family protein [Streptosporangiales bacterium]
MTEKTFTVDEAHGLMPQVRHQTERIVAVRADLAELSLELRSGEPSPQGGIPEAKALEATLDELISWFIANDIEVKGIAPVLVDFPAVLDGQSVRLCWLENEPELGWYHRTELGFVARRPLPHQ